MITKKTLTRQSIDELAKVCPPVIGSDSSSIYGGTHYYSVYSGNYLGKIGPSEEIMVVDPNAFNSCSGEVHDGAVPSGVMLSNASPTVQYLVVRQLAIEMIGSSIDFRPSYNPGYNMAVETDTKTGHRIVHMAYGYGYMDNMNSLKSTIEHEMFHYNDPNAMAGTGNMYGLEYDATMSQVTGMYWASTSSDYKEATFQALMNTFYNEHFHTDMPEFEKQRIRQEMGL